ncbi:hypothetical protein GF324_08670 [bacterium]|nr:hypothetical protein [bacterium]
MLVLAVLLALAASAALADAVRQAPSVAFTTAQSPDDTTRPKKKPKKKPSTGSGGGTMQGIAPDRPDTVSAPAPASLPDSLRPDSVTTDSLLADSLAADSLAVDSLAADSLEEPEQKPIRPFNTYPPHANVAGLPRTEVHYHWQGHDDAGDMLAPLPGLYPRHSSVYGAPFYFITPGGSGRDVQVLYRGRRMNNPVHGGVNLSLMSTEQIKAAQLNLGWAGKGPFSTGPVLELFPVWTFPEDPRTDIYYRQGMFDFGHANIDLTHTLHEAYRYHIGVDVGESKNRYQNTDAGTFLLRLGNEFNLDDKGMLGLYWMQSNVQVGRRVPDDGFFTTPPGQDTYRQHDIDIVWRKGAPTDTATWEAGAWWVRQFRTYDQHSVHSGGRLAHDRLFGRHRVSLEADAEYRAAKLGREEEGPDAHGHRTVFGATLGDRYRSSKLRWDLHTRIEAGTTTNDTLGPDSSLAIDTDTELLPVLGGAGMLELGDTTGFALIGQTHLGWRWPGLDEAYGHWTLLHPERDLDPNPLPDTLLSYWGNGALDPVGGLFAGGGTVYRWNEPYEARVTVGYRRYINPVETVEVRPLEFSTRNGDDRDGLEATLYGWVPLGWEPLSLAGAFTWSELGNEGQAVPKRWGWSELRFEKEFYHGQLRLRAAVQGQYLGAYDYPVRADSTFRQPALGMLDYRLYIGILNFELMLGVRNQFSTQYHYLPGYPSYWREEIWQVRWTLFN